MEKEQIIALVKKNINVPGLANDLVAEIVDKKLKEFVEDSANPYDNALYLALSPMLKKAIEDGVKTLWEKM